MFNIKKGVISLVLLVASHSSFSGAATGGSTEVTQIANNVELIAQVSEQMKTVKTLVDTYYLNIKKYQEMLLAGFKLPGELVATTRQGILAELEAIERYKNGLENASLSAQRLKQILNARSVESKLRNITFSQYVDEERARIQQGDRRARARIDHEVDVMRAVNEDFQRANEYSGFIDKTTGVHQSVAMLNTQMNRVINQNARMLSMMAYETGTKEAVKQTEEAQGRESLLNYMQALRTAKEQNRKAQLEEAKKFK